MLKNFEKITIELTPIELEYVEFLGQWFMQNKGKENTVKNKDIAKLIKTAFDKKVTEPRVRKIVQFLRTNGFPNLIATSNGYFYSDDIAEIEAWITSLKQREAAIREIREKAEREVEIIRFSKYARKQMEIF
jgi:hypothetical protein